MKILNKKPTAKKKFLIPIIAVVVVGLIAGGAYAYYRMNQTPANDSSDTTKGVDKNTTDTTYGSDKNDDINKDDNSSSVDKGNNSDTTKKDVSVGISYAGPAGDNVEVRAFVSGVIEGNGTCTATFTKGSASLSAKSSAFVDATTSQCEPIVFSKSQFNQSGTWHLVVAYESADAKGTGTLEVDL